MLYIPVEFDLIPELLEKGVTDQQIRDVLIKVASKFTPILQRSAPVDTGRLRRSLRVELLLSDTGVALTSEVWYAGFVELGTRRMRPRGYAASIVPELISYGNQLLAALIPGTVAGTEVRVKVNSDPLNTGLSTGQVSRVDFERIKPANLADRRVFSVRLPSITVTPSQVTPISIDPASVPPIDLL